MRYMAPLLRLGEMYTNGTNEIESHEAFLEEFVQFGGFRVLRVRGHDSYLVQEVGDK